jgi:hypothetical protein
MKCPILEIGWMQTKVGDKGVSSDCLKEECAWWECLTGMCSVHTLAYLAALPVVKEEIRNEAQAR